MPSRQIGLRLPVDLIEQIDAFVEKLQDREPGHEVSQQEAIRTLLRRALAAEGIGTETKPKKKKPATP